MGALTMPLARANKTTVVLDNTGHKTSSERAERKRRATSTKWSTSSSPRKPFDRDQCGEARLVRGRHRFPELPREIRLELGGGIYGPPTVVTATETSDGNFKPTILMQKISKAIENQPGITTIDIRALKGENAAKNTALRILIEEGYVRTEPHGRSVRHYSVKPYREADE
jgi:hypothetical protein